jgi:hypothetical protein
VDWTFAGQAGLRGSSAIVKSKYFAGFPLVLAFVREFAGAAADLKFMQPKQHVDVLTPLF